MEILPNLKRKLWRYRGAPRRVAGAARNHADRVARYLQAWLEQRRKDAAARRRRDRIDRFEKTRSAVTLFVVPEAGLAPFFAGHALVARSLADEGLGAVMLSCEGLLPICSVKFAMGTGATAPRDVEAPACVHCVAQAKGIGASYDLSSISIEQVMDAAQHAEVESLISASADALWELKYDGIDFGALGLGEVLRALRKASIADFTPADHVLLKAMLMASLSIYFAVRSLLSRLNIRHIAYYGDYAYHLPLLLLASRKGITVTHISHGYTGDVDHRYLSLRPGVAITHAIELIERWPGYRDRPLAPLEVEKIYDGALSRLHNHGGVSTYSPVWTFRDGDVRRKLGLDPAKKTIVAFPSSMDEIVCLRLFMQVMKVDFGKFDGAFKSHDDWLQKLIQWASGRNDLQLVVRLHPRMAAGVRFKSVAADVSRLKEALTDVPSNVLIEWPESKISSYALAEVADVAVTAWSSMALELSRLGVPVVSAFPDIALTSAGSFIGSGDTEEAFFQEIVRSAGRRSSLAAITEALRWTYIQHWSHLVDISEIPSSYSSVPPYQRPLNAKTIVEVVAGGKDLVEFNMSRHEGNASMSLLERKAVVRAVEKIVGLFGSGRLLDQGQGLLILDEAGTAIYRTLHCEANELTLRMSDEGTVSFEGSDGVVARYSKIARRLAELLRDAQGSDTQRLSHEHRACRLRPSVTLDDDLPCHMWRQK